MGSKPCWSLLQSWQRRLLAVRSAYVLEPSSSVAPLPRAVRAGTVRVADDGQCGLGEGRLLCLDGHAGDGVDACGLPSAAATASPFGYLPVHLQPHDRRSVGAAGAAADFHHARPGQLAGRHPGGAAAGLRASVATSGCLILRRSIGRQKRPCCAYALPRRN